MFELATIIASFVASHLASVYFIYYKQNNNFAFGIDALAFL